MNANVSPAVATLAGSPAPPVGADRARRVRVAALLVATTPMLAVTALSSPLAAAVLPGSSRIPHVSTVLAGGDPCKTTLTLGALNTTKYPLCAGD
jgi:hypothetical protein